MTFVEETVQDGLELREFTIGSDSHPITGALWQPAGAASGAPLVCLGHGASGDRHQAPIPWLVRRLVGDHGFNALSIDGPVHGRRQIGEGGRTAFWPEWERQGTVEDMNHDWRSSLDFVQRRPDVGHGPVGYWGLSMGTIYGAPFVASDDRVSAAVLGLMGISGPEHYRPTIEAAAAAIDVPLLFLLQLEDELFDRRECLALFDAFGSADKRLHANPGLHPAVPMEELEASVAFLVAVLTQGPRNRSAAFSVSS